MLDPNRNVGYLFKPSSLKTNRAHFLVLTLFSFLRNEIYDGTSQDHLRIHWKNK